MRVIPSAGELAAQPLQLTRGESAAVRRVDPATLGPDLEEEHKGADTRGVNGRVCQEKTRVLDRQAVLDANVACNAKRKAGRRREVELDDGYARLGQRLDVKVGLL
jgi:hypothetical protein